MQLLSIVAALALQAPAEINHIRPAATWEANFELKLPYKSKGAGIGWFPKSADTSKVTWDEPNVPGGLSIGFDSENPPSQDWFNADGNIDNKPQHEVSIHWNGMEIANRLSSVDFRSPYTKNVSVKVRFVTGGAMVDVAIEQTAVFKDYFVPTCLTFDAKLEGSEVTNSPSITKLTHKESGRALESSPPTTVSIFSSALTDAKSHSQTSLITVPPSLYGKDGLFRGRIIARLKLHEPQGGFDPWDRMAAVFVKDQSGKKIEILRYMTPYRRGHEWFYDVSYLAPLFKGQQNYEVWCETYGTGWLVDFDLIYYPGKVQKVAKRVELLWNEKPEIGNPDNSFEKQMPPTKVTRSEGTKAAELVITATGHGMEPNSNNAGEFYALGRTVTVGKSEFKNVLWKDDCYLNPCRPQRGTWKFSRAGWAPGDIVRPWVIDATRAVPTGKDVTIKYAIDPYLNEGRGKTWAPFHWIQGVYVEYSN